MASVRRLAAIMFTDITGYTPLFQKDEPAALRLLRDQDRLVRGLLEVHQGRLVKSMGDGLLIEFANALDAVECAVDLQRHIQERNAREPPPELRVRIGIHLGDVQEAGADLLGDTVNVASRIEPLADPGGVCLSEPVYSQVRNKVRYPLEKLGPRTLKGVQDPVEVYRVLFSGVVAATSPSVRGSGPPRLAVLPLVSISPDPKDEYFSDGLTEELITVLSQLKNLQVIARTSVMQYKATSKAVSQIGTELGVTSILEGSVRKAGTHLRITAQLIDCASQRHVWANTYDRELDDVFAVQAEIAKHVAETLRIELRATERARLESRPPVRADSYLAFLKGQTALDNPSVEGLEAAKVQFELAISLDSKNAAAYAGLADVIHVMGIWSTDVPQVKLDEIGRGLVARALELDPDLAEAHESLGSFLWDAFEWDAAEREFKLALSLNPSYSRAHLWYATLLMDEGRVDEALVECALAEGTDPFSLANLYGYAQLLLWLGRYDEALAKIQRLGKLDSSRSVYHDLMADYYSRRLDFEACLRELNRYDESTPDPHLRLMNRAWYHALVGEKDEARACLRQLEVLPRSASRDHGLALVHALLGDLDECFRLLEKLIENHLIMFRSWRLSPWLEHVRRDPRFQVLLKKMNLA